MVIQSSKVKINIFIFILIFYSCFFNFVRVLSQSKLENTKLISESLKSVVLKIGFSFLFFLIVFYSYYLFLEIQIKYATEIISKMIASSKCQTNVLFHPEDVIKLKKELQSITRFTIKNVIDKQKENLMVFYFIFNLLYFIQIIFYFLGK